MGDKFSKKLKFFRPLAEGVSLFLLFSLPAFAEGQNTAYLDADRKNHSASDTSLQHSTVYAMNALMDLGNLNIKSAVNNGMTAYGKYRNSETLDKLGDMNYNEASGLASVGSSTAAPRKTDTTFRRLDPKFLRQGEFAKVASEFEKKSGMPRETFLSELSEASEKKIKRSDPQLVSKVVGRFEGFLAKIPNKGFRDSLQKGVNMVPDSLRSSVISKAVSKFAGGLAAAPASAPSAVSAAGAPPSDTLAASEAAPVAAAAPAAEQAPAASLDTSETTRTPAAEDSANPLGNIIQAAIDTQGQDTTIFQLVTRRYRVLTPELAGR